VLATSLKLALLNYGTSSVWTSKSLSYLTFIMNIVHHTRSHFVLFWLDLDSLNWILSSQYMLEHLSKTSSDTSIFISATNNLNLFDWGELVLLFKHGFQERCTETMKDNSNFKINENLLEIRINIVHSWLKII
jgi:hypothetical protein